MYRSFLLSVVAVACGSSSDSAVDGGGDGDSAPGAADAAGGGFVPTDDELATATGCTGVFNPGQVLDYNLEMPEADWGAVRADTTNSVYYEAQFRCADEASIRVGVRRKRSGGSVKVGLKLDMNQFVPGQNFKGLKKLSLENGVSEGGTEDDADVSDYLSEYLSWRLMGEAGLVSGRAAFAKIHVNGEYIGVYVNVEQVDRRFLKHRLGNDDGWLYKKSGGLRDGLKTHETDGLVNPYEDYFCFWASGNSCAAPADLATSLPDHLDIDQLLRYGAVNAFISNADSLLFKDNNYYYYDWPGKRFYIPWDLDTVMKTNIDVFAGGGSSFVDVLFPTWEARYDEILTELIAGPMTLDAINAELDQAESVAGPAFAQDMYVTGTLADGVATLKAYWAQRHPEVVSQVEAH